MWQHDNLHTIIYRYVDKFSSSSDLIWSFKPPFLYSPTLNILVLNMYSYLTRKNQWSKLKSNLNFSAIGCKPELEGLRWISQLRTDSSVIIIECALSSGQLNLRVSHWRKSRCSSKDVVNTMFEIFLPNKLKFSGAQSQVTYQTSMITFPQGSSESPGLWVRIVIRVVCHLKCLHCYNLHA